MQKTTVKNFVLTSILAISMAATFPSAVSAETEVKFQCGVRTETSYENDTIELYADITDTPWYIATDEEMAQISGLTNDLINDNMNESMAAQLDNGGSVMDLYMMDTEYGDTLNIQIQKLSFMGNALIALMDDEKFTDTLIEQLEKNQSIQLIIDSLQLSDTDYGKGHLDFCGKEIPCFWLEGNLIYEDEVVPFHETMVFYRNNGYVATITAAAYYEDTTADAFDVFTDKK